MQPGSSQPVMLPGDCPMPRVAVPSWKLYGWSIRNPPEDRGCLGRSEPCACLCPEQCYSFHQTLGEILNHIDLEVVHLSTKDNAPGCLQAAHTPLSLLGQAWEGSSQRGVAEEASGLWELSYHIDWGHASR